VSGKRRLIADADAQVPLAFVERYSRFIPDFDAFLDAMQRPLRRTFRVNTLKATRERTLDLLADLKPEPLPWYELGFSLSDGEGLGKRIEHFIGLIYVQERPQWHRRWYSDRSPASECWTSPQRPARRRLRCQP